MDRVVHLSGIGRLADPAAARRVRDYFQRRERSVRALSESLGMAGRVKPDKDGFLDLIPIIEEAAHTGGSTARLDFMRKFKEASGGWFSGPVPPEAARYHQMDAACVQKRLILFDRLRNDMDGIFGNMLDDPGLNGRLGLLRMWAKVARMETKVLISGVTLGHEVKRVQMERNRLARHYGYEPVKP